MDFAICTSGLEFEVKDKAEAIYPLTFAARTPMNDVTTTSLPVKILMPKESTQEARTTSETTTRVDGAPTGTEENTHG